MDYSPGGSPDHGILQARILEWVAMPSSRGSSQPRDRTHIFYVSCIGRRGSLPLALLGSPICVQNPLNVIGIFKVKWNCKNKRKKKNNMSWICVILTVLIKNNTTENNLFLFTLYAYSRLYFMVCPQLDLRLLLLWCPKPNLGMHWCSVTRTLPFWSNHMLSNSCLWHANPAEFQFLKDGFTVFPSQEQRNINDLSSGRLK